MKHILIIEDDRRIALNISRSLTDEGYRTDIAYEGYNGRDLALQHPFDLVLLDINLPGLNGFEVCRNLHAAKPHLPVIMLTALGEVEDKVEGLARGADDYIVKPFDLRELSARVAACLRRTDRLDAAPTADEVVQVANLTVNFTATQVFRDDKRIDLTAKEFRLLDVLLRHKGRIVTKATLIERVWGFNFDPCTNVLEVYINYLRKKIDKDFEPKLIHTRPGLGYMLTAD